MSLGVAVNSVSTANPSPAAPSDANGRRLSRDTSSNTRTDEAAGRRAEKKADAERAEAKAAQIVKKVLDIKTADEKAAAASSTSSIDTYA